MGGRRWTPQEDARLLRAGLTPHTERYTGRSRLREAAAALGRSYGSCQSRLQRLMRRRGHQGGQWTREGLWEPREDCLVALTIEEHPERVPAGTWPDVAALLGRTVGAVRLRASKLRRDRS